jgi:RNA methyltransferase, RsmE family
MLQATTNTDKRYVTGMVQSSTPNPAPAIPITLYLPLLKKEAFEHAIYISAELGVSTIIPIITEKCHTSHESQRLYKIMIAACEQAKNFWIPKLHEPCNLTNVSFPHNALKICFDDEGKPSSTLPVTTAKEICITLGPEGGFSEREKNLLEQSGFQFYKLTKTILRSQEAVCVGLGVIQSILP